MVSMNRTVADEARALLSRGRAPVPISNTGRRKECYTEKWQKTTLSTAQVEERFPRDRPDACNLAVILGDVSGGLVDVDLDWPEARTAAPGLLLETAHVSGRASSPKSHYWYLTADRRSLVQFRDPLAPPDAGDRAIIAEFRDGHGLYTVVPPSVHESGERIEWVGPSLGEADPPTVPGKQLYAAVCRVAAVSLLARYWIAKGGRHVAHLALQGGLLRNGMAVEDVEAFTVALCRATGDDEERDRVRCIAGTAEKIANGDPATGWTKLTQYLGPPGETIVNTVREWLGMMPAPFSPNGKTPPPNGAPAAAANGPSKTRLTLLPEYEPFPLDVLPPAWQAFIAEASTALDCDPAYFALPAVSVLAAAIGMTRKISPTATWKEPPIVWTCVVSESGTLKSQAAKLIVDLLWRVQKRWKKDHTAAMADYNQQMECRRRARGIERANLPAEPAKPVMKRVLAMDTTIEKLASLLDDNPRGLLIYRDELAGWFGSFTRYKGAAGGSDESQWLSLYNGHGLMYDRKTGPKTEVMVDNAGASVTGSIQPRMLARTLTRDQFVSGLVPRIVFVYPPRRMKKLVKDPISPAVQKAVEQNVEDLLALQGEFDENDDPAPIVLKLSAPAEALWARFADAWNRDSFYRDNDARAVLAKLEGMAARIALIHHVATHVGTSEELEPVGVESLEAGIRFTKWAAREADRVHRVLWEDEEEERLRDLVESVVRLCGKDGNKGSVSVREVQRSNNRRYAKAGGADRAEADLQELVARGIGTWSDPINPDHGGHSTRRFVLSPNYARQHDTRPDDDDGPPPPDRPGPDDDRGPHDTRGDTRPPGENADYSKNGTTTCNNGTYGGNATQVQKSSVVQSCVVHSKFAENIEGDVRTSADASEWPFPAPKKSSVVQPLEIEGATLVTSPDQTKAVLEAVMASESVGLDTETTTLNPRTGRVRLLSLATAKGVFLLDLFRLPPVEVETVLGFVAQTEVVGHNLAFDLAFLRPFGFAPVRVWDAMLVSQVLEAGDIRARHTLAAVAKRHLAEDVVKDEQKSDWSRTLTAAQLTYAAKDAELPLRLKAVMQSKAEAAKLTGTVGLENRALPPLVTAAVTGVGFDATAWTALAEAASTERAKLAEEMNAIAPGEENLFGPDGRNWDSPQQVTAAFAALGITLASTDDDTLATVDHPLAEAMRKYRGCAKQVGTYGTEWVAKHVEAGRVHAQWKQIGARTGRMSCKAPNLQQVPRDKAYRKCFVPSPGCVFVKSDYSQVELRIAAKIADEKGMIAAYLKGDDLHTLTAAALTGKLVAQVTKDDRQLAKSVNFGLLYGMGAPSLVGYALSNYGVTITEEQAVQHRNTFFKTYPGIKRWHNAIRADLQRRINKSKDPTAETCPVATLAGRVQHLAVAKGKKETGFYPNLTEHSNSPVQGTGGDAIKIALGLLQDRQTECPTAVPVLIVHDEIVIECPTADAERAKGWLVTAMVDALAPLIDPVPAEVEANIVPTWGG